MIWQLFILSLPFILEVSIETYFEKKKHISLNHFWTSVARGVLMLAIAIAFNQFGVIAGWKALLLTFAIHFALFDYIYNRLTKRRLFYLRDVGIDKLLKEVHPLFLMFIRAMILLTAIQQYFNIWT